MFELILNVLLFVFFGWAFFTHVLEAAVPAKVLKNPYALKPDVWPKAIIILLEICLLINIIKIIRKNKGKENFTISANGIYVNTISRTSGTIRNANKTSTF